MTQTREEKAEYGRRYREKNRVRLLRKHRAYYRKNRDVFLRKAKKHSRTKGAIEKRRAWWKKLKTDVIEAYGGHCSCCGADFPGFLSVDHINGGGRKHMDSLGIHGGGSFYSWLKIA